MTKRIDLTGKKYGRLTVLECVGKGRDGKPLWRCECVCGNSALVLGHSLRTGNTKSCGCANGRFVDEIGKRYGRLIVMARADERGRGAFWTCRCDCGKEVPVRGGQLRRGITQSCGCLRDERTRAKHSLPLGMSAMNRAIANMKGNARRRSISWQLTDEQTIHLMGLNCHYCGVTPLHRSRGRNGDFSYNGLDRVDNRGGYEIGNVVTCCIICNNAKRALTLPRFLEWVKSVYKHSIVDAGLREFT